jgi:hypothetical protein
MFWVLFEVLPDKENWDDYLNNTKMLRPELEQIGGFVDNIRYKSPLLLRHRDSHVSRSHIGGAPVEITTEFLNAILRKTRRRERRYGDDCERLTFDVVVSGQLPHPAHSPARVYNGQRLRLRPSLARSTISQSRDTNCKVDQGRKIAKIGLHSFVKAIRQQRQSHLSLVAKDGMVPLVGSDRKPAATFGRTGSRKLIALPADGATAVGRPPHGGSSQSSSLGEAS